MYQFFLIFFRIFFSAQVQAPKPLLEGAGERRWLSGGRPLMASAAERSLNPS